MTELEWQTRCDPEMLSREFRSNANRQRMSTRKCWLYSVVCGRMIWDRLEEWPVARRVIDLAERYADGVVPAADLDAEYLEFWTAHAVAKRRLGHANPLEPFIMFFPGVTGNAIPFIAKAVRRATPRRARRRAIRLQANYHREIFGNPFRPAAFSPDWRTDTALALAREVYDSRDFCTMPILADALQDAGCDNTDILLHCRGEGPHVRGCWVVDLVLGKE